MKAGRHGSLVVGIWDHPSQAKLIVCVSSSLGGVVATVGPIVVVKVVLRVAQDALERRTVAMGASW